MSPHIIRSLTVSLNIVSFLAGLSIIAAAAEPGGATRPTLPAGLELWLDSCSLVATDPKPKSGSPVARWSDISGQKRDAVQADSAKQPSLVRVGESWVVRFDGDDDYLRIPGVHRKLDAFTLFVVGAPHSNLGMFRGLFAFNQTDRRDYESGFTFDLNAPLSTRLDNLNLEGRGFGGAQNLLKTPAPFGSLHVFECTADPQARRVRLTVDGQSQLDRPFSPTDLIMDDVTIGARFYTNEPNQPQQVRGFFQGDLVELILFNRVLTDDESKQVRNYLDQKHAALREALPRELKLGGDGNTEQLVTVTDPPPIQMLVPGFSVFELPVDLTNVNNVRYRADGKMYALGYNGDVWLLSDTDDDGLEDTAKKFFDSKGGLRGPIGMAVIPAGHALLNPAEPKCRGVVVPSKGKVSALLDHDGDDVADEERVIASGWKEIAQNVDAVGTVIGPDGSIYFGLGTTAYDNAYLIDKDGKAHYDIGSEHGTIQRILPDLSKRETVCTGVRFTIGMATNGISSGDDDQGDLFVTDQEGATWLPNGNPFDELLHIEAGRHYGFPPRHPRHLPDVVDMPSLFDYGPQHQSTCGIAFNLPRPFALAGDQGVSHDATFGPAQWEGSLFVTGESRGKLYRTELALNDKGYYFARNHLIACLSMLTIDCCLSPEGDMVIACHSGGPDWGSGPNGKGKLFKIRYSDPNLAQPVVAWAAGPQEVRIAFDRPIDPAHLQNLAAETRITYGAYVAAGDRFETFWPGYAVVQMQKMAPRYNLPVRGVNVMPDRRTLVIATAPQPVAWQYAVTLPGLGRDTSMAQPSSTGATGRVRKELPQHAQVDLAYSLNGVDAKWEPKDPSQTGWSGWLPALDLDVVNALSVGNADDDRFWEVIKQSGTLTLETKLDVRDMLHPAVQPGSKLDHEWPQEQIQFIFECDRSLELDSDVGTRTTLKNDRDEGVTLAQTIPSSTAQPVKLRLKMTTGDGPPSLNTSWFHESFETAQSLPLHRHIIPWAEIKLNTDVPARRTIPELAGGSWGRGRRVFFSEEAGCAKCHVPQTDAGRIGPDLANLIHRDYASVLRDVTFPSFALNPDYLSSIVTLKDGRVLTGAIRSQGEKLQIGDKDGRVHIVFRNEVEEMQHSPISVMPEGIPKKLGPDKLRDLLTYLLMEPPSMPLESPLPPPKPRTRAEVAAILAGSTDLLSGGRESAGKDLNSARIQPADSHPPLRKLTFLLVAGAKDHGPGEHDYPAWLKNWSELLRGAEGVTVQTAMEWPSDEQIAAADTIAFFQKGSWNADRARAIDAHLARRGGLVYIHWAVEAGAEAPAFAQRIGLASDAGKLKFRHGPLDLGFESGRDHPIGRNFDKVHFYDESYWQMQGHLSAARILASGIEDGAAQPLFWTLEPSKGKVFVSILGHYSWTFDDPLFRILLLRGLAWTANEPVDRFNELVTIGVKLAD